MDFLLKLVVGMTVLATIAAVNEGECQGVFIVTINVATSLVDRVYSVNTYLIDIRRVSERSCDRLSELSD